MHIERKIVLPSGDSKAEAKARTYCPTTWNYSYQWTYASQYADQLRKDAEASALLCKECTLLVRIQLSNKNANHVNCAFADSMSTAMCGAMISLTPCIAPTVERDCDLGEFVEFQNSTSMIETLNGILAKSESFPSIPIPRKDCHTFYAQSGKRFKQYVICPEQDCDALSACPIRTPAWLKLWVLEIIHCGKRESKTSMAGIQSPTCPSRHPKDAWTWEEGSASKWSTTFTRGSSKRGQSVPVDPAKRGNPEEKGLPWKDIGPMDTSHEWVYPDDPANPCPVVMADQLSPEQQVVYIQWIVHILKLDHKTSKDPRVYLCLL